MEVTLKTSLAAQTRLMLNNAPVLPVIGNRYHSATLRRKAAQTLDSALEGYDAKAKDVAELLSERNSKIEGFRKELQAISDKPDADKEAEFKAFAEAAESETDAKVEAIGKAGYITRVGEDGKRRSVVIVDDGSDVSVELTDEQAELLKAVFLTDGPDWFVSEEAMVEAGCKFGVE